MKPDGDDPAARHPDGRDDIERAHLKDPHDASHTIHRYPAAPDLTDLMQRYWIPVWSVPPGREAPQRVLRYPVCQVVVAHDYARFYGVEHGLSTVTLTGEGWAVGSMLSPAAGALLTGTSLAAFTDRAVDLTDVLGAPGARLITRIREAMEHCPDSPESHASAMEAFDDALRAYLPIDEEGRLVNRVVAFVEENSDVLRVEQVRAEFDLGERALQRLVHRRIGLTPKWLIQRRRLQEAAGRLRDRSGSLSEVAAVLGYADQPHFVRDFAKVVGMTPGTFAARYGSGDRPPRRGPAIPAHVPHSGMS
ncbi:helix-turn-helix domain-containing protein [Rhodococcus sp. B50]|uniref:helix-turn-helix domain-containing protein n=1 Tax=Rhodococcus sp. B50 TaxID=2682847 RepID=UPI001BD28C4A|nr:helix-turn-helix domain-containing protein [Rhodococcus sp. B50]MBS9373029.1 HTH-type transcriptional activator RhaS [Rhodococcus sp. B50]